MHQSDEKYKILIQQLNKYKFVSQKYIIVTSSETIFW